MRNRIGLFVITAALLSLWVAAPTSTSALPIGACAGRAYITGKSGDELMIVDTISDSVVTTLTAASNGLDLPVGFRISPDGNFGYLANYGNDEVLKIDLETNATVTSFPINYPYYIGITPDGSKIAVSQRNSAAIGIIDTSTGSTSYVSISSNPFEVLINNAGTRIYAAGSNTIWVIDLLSETVLHTIPTSGGGLGIGILPDDSKVYIAQSADGVDVLDTATNTLTNIAIPDDPYWITVSPDGSTVWAVLYGNNSGAVARIATSTDTVIATIQTPSAPNAYLSGITADGSKLYVFGYNPGTDLVNPLTESVETAAWTAPGDPWDFQTCPFAAPPTPTSTSSTTSESNPVAPAFTG